MADEYKGKEMFELYETSKLDLDSFFMINDSNRMTKRINFRGIIANLKGNGTDKDNTFYNKEETDSLVNGMRTTVNKTIESFTPTIEEIKKSSNDINKNMTIISSDVSSKLNNFAKEIEAANNEMTSIRNYIKQFIEQNPNDTYTREQIDQLFTGINNKLSSLYTPIQIDEMVKSINTEIENINKKITDLQNNMTTGGNISSGGTTSGTAEGLSITNITSGSINLDTYKVAKIYHITKDVTLTNAPTGCTDGWLIVLPNEGVGELTDQSQYVKQIFFNNGAINSTDHYIYMRTYQVLDGFSEWVKLTTSKDIIIGSEIPTSLSENQIYLQYF